MRVPKSLSGEHPPAINVMRSSRWLAFAAVVAALLATILVVSRAGRDGGATASLSPRATATASGTAAVATPTASSSSAGPTSTGASVLDDRFGLLVYDEDAKVRSEASDAVISSFPAKSRSFTFYSRVISPDGRSVAYWDPVANGAVLHVRPVTGGTDRAVLTVRPAMMGNAFAWSSDGTGIVAALDNNCQELCAGPAVNELWTIDLASGATERVASGSIWLPVTWDRAAKRIAAGVTGPGGYLTAYNVIDLNKQPYVVRGTPFTPTVIGQLKASSDARYVLFRTMGSPDSLAWWPLAEPDKRSQLAFDGAAAEWRPGTSEIWWSSGLTPAGCRTAPCAATELVSFDVMTGARRSIARGGVGALLIGFRVDGSAAITAVPGTSTVIVVDVQSGSTATITVSGQLGEPVRLR